MSLEGTATQTAVAEIAFAAADVFTEMIAAYRTDGKLPSIKALSKKIEDLTAAPALEKARGDSKPTGRKSADTATTGKKLASKGSASKKSIGRKSASKKSAGSKSASSKSAGRKSAKSSSKISSKRSAKSSVKTSAKKTAKSVASRSVKSSAGKTSAVNRSAAKTTPAAKVASLWTEYEKLAMTKAQAGGLSVYHVVVKIDPHCAMPIAGRQLIHNALGAVGQVLAVHPDAKSPAASKQVEFVLASAQTVAADFGQGPHSNDRGRSRGRVAAGAESGSAENRRRTRFRARSCRRRQFLRARTKRMPRFPLLPPDRPWPRPRRICCGSKPDASTACSTWWVN